MGIVLSVQRVCARERLIKGTVTREPTFSINQLEDEWSPWKEEGCPNLPTLVWKEISPALNCVSLCMFVVQLLPT